MNKLWGATGSAVIFCLLLVSSLAAQSPHGENLRISCDACHNADSWAINRDSISFDHDTTRFSLHGQHAIIDCRACHTTLAFERTPTDCASCHTDMHQGTVGFDCARCHNSDSWLVNNVTEIHQEVGFPLIGAHATLNCFECHVSDTDLRFEPLGLACINCHRDDYEATTNPDHQAAGYSTECNECHTITAFEWSATGIDHNFFPLTQGHDINDCARCHTTTNYSTTSPECITCHQTDFEAALEPNHIAANLPTDCATCHTTHPDWEPAEFTSHDGLYFPIYSGEHNGVWSQCLDCHKNSSNYAEFTCIACHTNPETDEHHGEVDGYSHNDGACLACHPNGNAEDDFNHNETDFPLTGAHTVTECIACHFNGYAGTPTTCTTCHDKDFQQTANPDHEGLGLSMDCAMCHTTDPEWNPAAFPDHNNFYVLAGAHAAIAMECATCHNGDYVNTPNTCVGCHLAEYNATTDPSHTAAQFSTDCTTCHNENTWQPATFDHDAQYFPIYSGSHEGEWSQCVDCHINPGNYAEVTCITCHMNPETDEEHSSVNGYSYQTTACLACHPNGENDGAFDHNMTGFALTGAHTTTECLACHAAGFEGTPTTCAACHTPEFQQTVNPNHQAIGISMECATCHTTEPGWSPASFPEHNDHYVIAGAHVPIAMECAQCHNGDYTNTPNTCAGCHLDDYTQTTDPNHAASLFPTECIICHNETAWEPSMFDHNLTEFPLTGVHVTVDCAMCHASGYTGTPAECIACHTTDFEQTQNPNHAAIGLSTDCAMCHTTDPEWNPASFPNHNDYYVLQGAHAAVAMECALCHNGDYTTTPNTCVGCHLEEFNATMNPSHLTAQFSTDCATCHNETAWDPATFDHDGQYFPIYSGSHLGQWSQCIDCHTNPSNFAEFTCVTCHANPETDEQHGGVSGYVYQSTACLACHPTGEGEGFDHNMTAFPLTGAHTTTECLSCHGGGFTGTPTECVACHTSDFEQAVNPNHTGLGLSTDCASCHTTEPGWSPATFPVHNEFYVFEGAHIPISMECALCHNGDYINTPNTCVGCHLDNFNQTVDPNHVVSQFPTECAVCHSQSAWQPAEFDHNETDFPLTGAHIPVDCASCHAAGYTGTPTECASCHIAAFNQSANPDHLELGLSTDCAMCHTTDPEWNPAVFPVHNEYYVLQGAHAAIATECASCHNGNYNNTPNTCVGCHIDNFNATSDPDHQASGFPTDCILCHNETAWLPSSFNHNLTDFPLTGAHIPVDCASCHASGYSGTPTECAACHQANFNQSTNPNHVVLGLSTDCASCHTTNPDWEPATFAVHNNYYALIGAHAVIANDCAQCHNGNYNNTPNTCVGCHLAEYNATNDPDHQSAQFPTDCAQCHGQNVWEPSTFDHDNLYFPIYDGKHEGEWNQCNDCHTNPNNYAIFTCITCHTAGETNDDHDEVNGYQYNSAACLACHPNGEED